MKRNPPIIAASILSARFGRLAEDTKAMLNAGAEWVHFDVMDNHYVPNLTIGPMVCQALRDEEITAPIDVHLMVTPVDALAEQFAIAGATHITFHPEATFHPHRSIQLIKKLGCTVGIALNPGTPVEMLTDLLPDIDLILLMSVNPGFGGQTFIPQILEKIKRVRHLIDRSGKNIALQVDGGIYLENIRAIYDAGADHFVMGTALFKAQKSYEAVIQDLKSVFSKE